MNNTLINRALVDFALFDWLRLDEVLARSRHEAHDRESVTSLIDLSERIARESFLPHYKKSDRDEPRLTEDGVEILPEIGEAVHRYAEAGFIAAPFGEAVGGFDLPELVHVACLAHFMAANVATAAYPMLTTGNARLLAAFGTPAQVDTFVRPQLTGDTFGTMCLSEPQAGSSLADITTRAQRERDDPLGERYRLTGNKMWISGGDQNVSSNIFHLVLAKIPGADGSLPDGTAGISLFVVPKWLVGPDGQRGERNDVVVAGLNHKMGYRGTSNCLLNLGEGTRHRPEGAAGAIGYLVGKPGEGLPQMFHMMNEARISVGLGAAALACRAHLLSVEYAHERRQGRTRRDPSALAVAIIEHADVKRMLISQKCYAEGALSLILLCARLVDDRNTAPSQREREDAEKLLELLTPAAKTWASEWGVEACDLAIQIHGGYGYTRDFDVEQLWRDNRLNPIHEGTSGIQAADFVGRKLIRDKGAALALFLERARTSCKTAAGHAELAPVAASLLAWSDRFDEVARLSIIARPHTALANAGAVLSAFGHLVVAWILLDQAATAKTSGHAAEMVEARLASCRYFIEAELPSIGPLLKLAEDECDAASSLPPGIFTH